MSRPPHPPIDAIPEELRRRWLRWLESSWRRINELSLGGRLRPPVFSIDRGAGRLGQWRPDSRTLGIGAEHLLGSHWAQIELTLRHEMAHQVVSELFDAPMAQPHGPLFFKACRMLGIEASPRHSSGPDEAGRRMLERVRKLLSLAGSDNPHEARAAMATANKLLLEHNLERCDAADVEEPGYTWRWIGLPTGRIALERKVISGLLQDFFFVQCIWVPTRNTRTGKSAMILEVSGCPHNLALAEHAHDYLTGTLDRLWKLERRANGPGGNAGRNEYRVGVLLGFREHLEAGRAQCSEQGLIWLGDPALDDFLSSRHPRTRRLRRGRYRLTERHDRGREEGRRLRIRSPIERAGSRRLSLPPAPDDSGGAAAGSAGVDGLE